MKGVMHYIRVDLDIIDHAHVLIRELERLLAKHAEFTRLYGA